MAGRSSGDRRRDRGAEKTICIWAVHLISSYVSFLSPGSAPSLLLS